MYVTAVVITRFEMVGTRALALRPDGDRTLPSAPSPASVGHHFGQALSFSVVVKAERLWWVCARDV